MYRNYFAILLIYGVFSILCVGTTAQQNVQAPIMEVQEMITIGRFNDALKQANLQLTLYQTDIESRRPGKATGQTDSHLFTAGG